MDGRIYRCEHLFNAKALKSYRKQLGLTQAEFCKRTGISTVSISKLENEKTVFTPAFKRQIEEFYKKIEAGGSDHESDESIDAMIFSSLMFLTKDGKKKLYKYLSDLLLDDGKRTIRSIKVSIN